MTRETEMARWVAARLLGMVYVPWAREVAGLWGEIYRLPGHEVGGCLHVILDDGNMSNVSIAHALLNGDLCRHCRIMAAVLMRCTWTQRHKAQGLAYKARSIRRKETIR